MVALVSTGKEQMSIGRELVVELVSTLTYYSANLKDS